MLCAELAVELRQGLVFLLPHRDLILELPDELVLRHHLRVDVGRYAAELALQGLDSLSRSLNQYGPDEHGKETNSVVLLQHHLITFVLAPHTK